MKANILPINKTEIKFDIQKHQGANKLCSKTFTEPEICDSCNGSGMKDDFSCSACNAKGIL